MVDSALTSNLDRDTVRKETSVASIDGMSARAAQRLVGEVQAYDSDLRLEARSMARHEDADVISERHVRLAVEHLRHSKAERSIAIRNTLGGVLLGLAFSIAMQLSKAPLTVTEVMVGLISCLLAGALLTPLMSRR